MQRINVTKTFLPPREEYQKYLKQIWENGYITNQGPLLKEFEAKLREYLSADNLHFVGNGTLALQVSLRALGITEGEVITTPFSYVATTSSILWEKLTPVFIDIEEDTLNMDASKIEDAITPKTKAIMPVHVFGNPCNIEKIDAIAKKHNLKVIYDAAHAFGAQYKSKPLLNQGDISIGSFHATKLFHTIEGGLIVVKDKNVSEQIELIKRFGHDGDEHYMLGLNAKASEFQAAMGLCNLKYVDGLIEKRGKVSALYNRLLGDSVRKVKLQKELKYNYGYYPVILDSEVATTNKISALNSENIFPRRYFYPSLNTLPYIKHANHCPVSEDISKRILCLPLYEDLAVEDVERICEIVNR